MEDPVMDDMDVQPAETAADDDSTLTFKVKRSHFYALMVPLFFLLGLTIGYLAWGRAPVAAAPSSPLASSSENEIVGDTGLPTATAQSLAEEVAAQIPTLSRHEIEIADNDPVYGPEDAPITIVEFADFQCPYCQRHFEQVYPELQAAYGDQIRYIYKDFPLTAIHPDALPSALAAQCANEQGAFWEYHDLLFGGGLGLDRASFESYAEQLNLDMDEFTACLDEDRYMDDIEADVTEAGSIGLSSTPTFFINGLALVGAQPYEVFEAIIDYELANPSSN